MYAAVSRVWAEACSTWAESSFFFAAERSMEAAESLAVKFQVHGQFRGAKGCACAARTGRPFCKCVYGLCKWKGKTMSKFRG
jgi:hypothetical protein